MNSFEMNKVLGAVLGTCLGVVALNITAGAIFTPERPAKPGYEIAVPEKPPPGAAKEQPKQPEVPLEQLLANADVGRGQGAAQKCAACHSFEKGGKTVVGPDLWGVVGRPKGSVPGFSYSPGMKAKGGNWTVPELMQFITN